MMIATESRPLHTNVDGGGKTGTSRWGPKVANGSVPSTHGPDPGTDGTTVG